SEQPSLKDAGKGLNISGFAMLGTFYIWSGFTENTGWAHTNTGSDYEDVYLEKFDHPADSLRYHYGTGYKRATIWKDTLFYKSGNEIKKKIFEFRKTHRGPLIAKRDSLWITMRSAAENPALYVLQSWRMCRAKNLKEFTAAMGHVQLTTNTMYADRSGNIAYWHGNAIPRRNESFDWKLPVDGSNPLTEWQGIHSLNEIIHVVNPASGWIQNCNATPFKSAGQNSPVKKNYPAYMSYEDQNYRADEAIRLLMQPGKFSFSEFGDWVTSNHLPMMEGWLPQILKAFDAQPKKIAEQHVSLKHAADTLRKWDYRYATGSKATTLAVFWYRSYLDWVKKQARGRFYGDYSGLMIYAVKLPAPDSVAVALLSNAVDSLRSKYGTEFISWGDINRLQRIHSSGSLEKFDDNKFSLPVDAVPSGMGSLFAFQTRTDPGQKKMYGVAGNTYTAIIEFGKKIQAKSIVTFGQSANPGSPHYFDQASLYAAGEFKDVYFYKKDVMKHARRKYHPGE
ncbi:MAG: penicillin acylase family protein, partial [Ferruginibacter sp.]